jgi:hypothetical protein
MFYALVVYSLVPVKTGLGVLCLKRRQIARNYELSCVDVLHYNGSVLYGFDVKSPF